MPTLSEQDFIDIIRAFTVLSIEPDEDFVEAYNDKALKQILESGAGHRSLIGFAWLRIVPKMEVVEAWLDTLVEEIDSSGMSHLNDILHTMSILRIVPDERVTQAVAERILDLCVSKERGVTDMLYSLAIISYFEGLSETCIGHIKESGDALFKIVQDNYETMSNRDRYHLFLASVVFGRSGIAEDLIPFLRGYASKIEPIITDTQGTLSEILRAAASEAESSSPFPISISVDQGAFADALGSTVDIVIRISGGRRDSDVVVQMDGPKQFLWQEQCGRTGGLYSGEVLLQNGVVCEQGMEGRVFRVPYTMVDDYLDRGDEGVIELSRAIINRALEWHLGLVPRKTSVSQTGMTMGRW